MTPTKTHLQPFPFPPFPPSLPFPPRLPLRVPPLHESIHPPPIPPLHPVRSFDLGLSPRLDLRREEISALTSPSRSQPNLVPSFLLRRPLAVPQLSNTHHPIPSLSSGTTLLSSALASLPFSLQKLPTTSPGRLPLPPLLAQPHETRPSNLRSRHLVELNSSSGIGEATH